MEGTDEESSQVDDSPQNLELDLPQHSVLARTRHILDEYRRQVDDGEEPTFALGNRILSVRRNGRVHAYTRVMVLLTLVEKLLSENKTTSQRDIYYRLKNYDPLFATTAIVSAAIKDIITLLNVPRCSLGIINSSRGSVAGSLYIKERDDSPHWIDCSNLASASGLSIPGDPRVIRSYTFHSTAQAVVVIEKEAILHRLVDEGLHKQVPCILVTGRGFPDISTRVFLSCLTKTLPGVPVYGLVDWNPMGVSILRTYRLGGRVSPEAPDIAIPQLGWLGARWAHIHTAPVHAFQYLTARDRQILPGLMDSLNAEGLDDWMEEVVTMEEHNAKAELEAMANSGLSLMDMVLHALLTV